MAGAVACGSDLHAPEAGPVSLKKIVDRVLGRDPNVKVQRADVPCELLGTEYGGHTLATAGLHTGSVVYSFGVGEDVSFDVALIQRFGSIVHAFDPTPRGSSRMALGCCPFDHKCSKQAGILVGCYWDVAEMACSGHGDMG